MAKYSFLTKKLFIKVSMMRRSRLHVVLFLQGKSLCFGMCQQVACEVFIVWRSSLKKWYLRLYLTQIMHSNGKILFLDEKIVYQSFYDVPLMFSSFSSRKSLCFGTRLQVACEVFIVWRSSLKKWYIRFHLTQIVHLNGKMLFFQPKDCLSKFLWCAALVKLFFL